MDERQMLATLEQSLAPASAARLTADERKLLAAIEQKVNGGSSRLTADERKLLAAIVGAGAVGDERELLAHWLTDAGGAAQGDQRSLLQQLQTAAPAAQGITLPQYLVTQTGTLYEGFETAADWTAVSGSVANNATQFHSGTQSLKFSSNAGATATFTKTVNWDLSGDWGHLHMWIYVHNTTLSDYAGNFMVRLSNNAGVTNYKAVYTPASQIFVSGWNHFVFPKSYFYTGGTGTFASPIIRIQVEVRGAATKVAEISADSLYFGYVGVPNVAMTFDDGYASQYTQAFTYMQSKGLRGTLAVITSWPGGGGYATWAQLREMDAAGWTIANHTADTPSLTGLSQAQQEARIVAGRDALLAQGLSRGANYLVFPNGNHDTLTMAACAATGVLAARTALSDKPPAPTTTYIVNQPPMLNPYLLRCKTVANTDALATVEGWIDTAISSRTATWLLFHNIGAANNMSVADFQALCDYIANKKAQGLIYDLTIDDFYRSLSGPITIPA